jgi:indole-3-glycerol phosphate synthase
MILQKIVGERKRQVEALKQALPLEEIIRLLEEPNELQRSMRRTSRDLKQAVRQALGLGIIAEVKQASPSKGIIRRDFDPLATAREYEIYGAVGISVLTEPKYFLGRDEYLVEIAAAVSIPVLRKDFIVDQYQIYQSKLLGADCILLIAAALDDDELAGFLRVAQELGLQCLVEVHCKEELERVLQADAGFIGINNRDLNTFVTDLQTTLELAPLIPKDVVVVSESGIHTREDMRLLEEAGVDGVLIGESLMRAPSIALKFRELRGERCE